VSARALVLAYHAVERGPAPLCVEPALFAEQLDLIVEAGMVTTTVGALADELEAEGPEEPSVAITFDDGFASVFEQAAPLLRERGIPATVFCVAGHLGGRNDWPTEPPSAPKLALAPASDLREARRHGLEIGSHGFTHLPLGLAGRDELEREVVASREALQEAAGTAVSWFAYPGGLLPGAAGRALVERTYSGAAAGGNRTARPGAGRWLFPRIEMHYLRRPAILRRCLHGGDSYLALRRAGARLRRVASRDYVRP
jgi:peptidoglycan/xylan/chitin deacetylase (PgdA/CDA1 family)